MRLKSAYTSWSALRHSQLIGRNSQQSQLPNNETQRSLGHMSTDILRCIGDFVNIFHLKDYLFRFSTNSVAESPRFPLSALAWGFPYHNPEDDKFKMPSLKQVASFIFKTVRSICVGVIEQFIQDMGTILGIILITWIVDIIFTKSSVVSSLKEFFEIDSPSSNNVTFSDVAGCDEAKAELVEVVDFLKNSTKYTLAGAKVPRGVLLEGLPGVGKTMLAKAVAGEAKVAFIARSGSSFIELFVGQGAKRVRELFAEAKRKAPCIIFIDEIDSLGARDKYMSTSEHDQTLNQILTEMDGFDSTANIVVIGATNRANILDDALLRPGRFDRRLQIELPDRRGREAILRVHASHNKTLDSSVNLTSLASRTTGMSGASLALLINEAAMSTARRNQTNITSVDIEHALDRVTMGSERKTGMASGKNLKLIAYHEAGHAIAVAMCGSDDIKLSKVTIIPRSNGIGGFTASVNSEELQDGGMVSKAYLQAQLMIAFGGRVAEELYVGDDAATTGASSDLEHIAAIARSMVTKYGFSFQKGQMILHGCENAAQKTRERIDVEIESLVNDAYRKCKTLLRRNRQLLDELVKLLLVEETIDEKQLRILISKFAK